MKRWERRAAQRAEVVDRGTAAQAAAAARQYARKDPDGRPVRCRPGPPAPDGAVHSENKLVYNTAALAARAALAIAAISGSPPMVPYPCDRPPAGHHHLTRQGVQ